jgi:hypothetical protein
MLEKHKYRMIQMIFKTRTSRPVRQTMVNAIPRELLRGRGAKNKVALEACVHNLDNDLLVREADDQAVFGCVVLVLCLGDEAFAGVVWGRFECEFFDDEWMNVQSVFPSRRRRYLTWNREK